MLAVVALAYLPVLAAGFVWDDALLVENTLTGSLLNLPRFFAVDLWSTNPEGAGSGYCPVLLDFAIDRALFGLWAWGTTSTASRGTRRGRPARPWRAGWAPARSPPPAPWPCWGCTPRVSRPAWISARNDPMATT